MYQIIFFVPPEFAEQVKEAMFAAGAGALGNYDRCSWETEGTGQFRPLDGSRPSIGSRGKLERLPELRVEMLCAGECLEEVVAALKKTHPYEEPAYYAVATKI